MTKSEFIKRFEAATGKKIIKDGIVMDLGKVYFSAYAPGSMRSPIYKIDAKTGNTYSTAHLKAAIEAVGGKQ